MDLFLNEHTKQLYLRESDKNEGTFFFGFVAAFLWSFCCCGFLFVFVFFRLLFSCHYGVIAFVVILV